MLKQDEVYTGLTELFNDIFDRTDIVLTSRTTAFDIAGWNSMRQIEIIIAVGERYGFKFTTKEMDGLDSVGDLAAVVMKRGQ